MLFCVGHVWEACAVCGLTDGSVFFSVLGCLWMMHVGTAVCVLNV